MKSKTTIKTVFFFGFMAILFLNNAKAQVGTNKTQLQNIGYGIDFTTKRTQPCDSTAGQFWDTFNNKWLFNSALDVLLNPTGYIEQFTVFGSSSNGKGIKFIATRDVNNRVTKVTEYDSTNKIIAEIDPIYNSSGLIIQDVGEELYTYDSSGNMILKKELYNSTDPNSSLDSFYYNASNLMVKNVYYTWDGYKYNLYTSYVETYNVNNKITSEKQTPVAGSATNHIYIYDGSGKLVSDIFSNNNQVYSKDTLFYDTKGELISTTISNFVNGSWSLADKYTYTYDANGELILSTGYSFSQGTWVLYNRSGCASAFSGISKISKSFGISIYPNPANGNIHIQYSGISQDMTDINIVNMQGQEVYRQKMQFTQNSPATIETGSIPAGIYIVKAENDKGIYSQRLIILK